MLELNLMPKDMQAFKRKKKSPSLDLKLPNIPPVHIIIGVIVIMIATQLLLGFIAFRQKSALSSISKKTVSLTPQKDMALILKKQADELSGRFTVIEGLTQGSLVWSKKLYDLSNSMIDGIWLSSLSLNVESLKGTRAQRDKNNLDKQTMVITGMAVTSGAREETAAVGQFIDSLKNNKDFFSDFDDIKLSSIQRESYGDTEAMSFTIVCYFKQDRSYFERFQG